MCTYTFKDLLVTKPADGEISSDAGNHSKSVQLEKLLNERKQQAALVSQTRVSLQDIVYSN